MYFFLLGEKEATVTCASTDETFAESSCPSDKKPNDEAISCEQVACSNFQWEVSNGECSKSCDSGMLHCFFFLLKISTFNIMGML